MQIWRGYQDHINARIRFADPEEDDKRRHEEEVQVVYSSTAMEEAEDSGSGFDINALINPDRAAERAAAGAYGGMALALGVGSGSGTAADIEEQIDSLRARHPDRSTESLRELVRRRNY